MNLRSNQASCHVHPSTRDVEGRLHLGHKPSEALATGSAMASSVVAARTVCRASSHRAKRSRRWRIGAGGEEEDMVEGSEEEGAKEEDDEDEKDGGLPWKNKEMPWTDVGWKAKDTRNRAREFRRTPIYLTSARTIAKVRKTTAGVVDALAQLLIHKRWKWMVEHLAAMASAYVLLVIFMATAPYYTTEYLAYKWPQCIATEHLKYKLKNRKLTPKFSKSGKLPKRPGVLEELIQPSTVMEQAKQEIEDKRYADLNGSFFFLETATGAYVERNKDVMFSAGSTIKLPILIAFLQAVDSGEVSLTEKLTVKDELVGAGAGGMQYKPLGTQYEAVEVADQMIVVSDNTATNMIIERLGGILALNRVFKSWGLQDTFIRANLPDLDGTNSTSARDMVYLLALLERGHLLSMRNRDLALNIMKDTVSNTMLPAGVGPGAVVAHKTGDVGFIVGDVGIVDMPKGGRFIAAALVRGPYNSSTTVSYISNVCSKFYHEVYSYLRDHDARRQKSMQH